MKNKEWNIRKIILLVVNAVLLLLFLIVSCATKSSVNRLDSQQEAARWANGKDPYAQVSAFFSPEQGIQEDTIANVRGSINGKLADDAYDVGQENVRVWIDGYSGECQTSVRRDTNELSVTAVGVGGDFFQFHPYPLLSGSYISESDMNHDRIVVDRGFAWAMFGSNDIVGMQIWMDNTIYTIVGVVAVDEEKVSQTAYGNGNRIYFLYDQLKKQQEGLKITCYEAVLPNPITNYASGVVKSAFDLPEEEEDTLQKNDNPLNFNNIEVLENSNRFQFLSLYKKIKSRKFRSMRTNSIMYPHWENVARVVEDRQMTWLLVKLWLLVIPCISLIGLVYYLWKNRSWTMKDVVKGLIAKIRERREAAKEELDLMDEDVQEEDDSLKEEEPEQNETDAVKGKEEPEQNEIDAVKGKKEPGQKETEEKTKAETEEESTNNRKSGRSRKKRKNADRNGKSEQNEVELCSVTSIDIFKS